MAEQSLPAWGSVAVVVAHPDDESFGLGAVIATFVGSGARVQVVCLTKGEASTLGEEAEDLAALRTAEFHEAASRLGVARAVLLDFPDGGLSEIPVSRILPAVAASLEPAEGLLAFDSDGVTGHPDHVRATEIAVLLAHRWGRGLVALTMPDELARTLREETGATYVGHADAEIDVELTVDREVQRRAIDAHPSQAVPGSVLWRRLELQGPREWLRWLVRPPG